MDRQLIEDTLAVLKTHEYCYEDMGGTRQCPSCWTENRQYQHPPPHRKDCPFALVRDRWETLLRQLLALVPETEPKKTVYDHLLSDD